ncbi:MAG: Hsp20/alpha crystallin family protein [Acidimicrobiales bacterium]|jgi:HSP20 family protein
MPLLVHADPFRDVDRFMHELMEEVTLRTPAMPMDAYRKGDDAYLLQFDLPGVTMDAIDLTVEHDILTVKVEREVPAMTDDLVAVATERPHGTVTRRVFLGERLDTAHIEAHYDRGVLFVSIPVAADAKPRRIKVRPAATAKEIAS